jgi:hypothetical protein
VPLWQKPGGQNKPKTNRYKPKNGNGHPALRLLRSFAAIRACRTARSESVGLSWLACVQNKMNTNQSNRFLTSVNQKMESPFAAISALIFI